MCTGRVEQGVVKKGDEVEILGRGKKPQKSVITGIRMFNTDLPEGPAGYTVGVLCLCQPLSYLGDTLRFYILKSNKSIRNRNFVFFNTIPTMN